MTVSIPVTWKSDARSIITTPRGWPTIWLAVTGVVTLGSLLAFWSLNSGPPTLPVLGQLPTFQLRERSGALVDNDSLRHRVWVAAFFFTRCPGPCLTMTKRMAALRRELPVEVHLVSISVDPQTDQPAVLSQYAERFGIVPGDVGWLFLTGEQSNIFRLAREGFHLAVDAPEHPVLEGPDATPLSAYLHSTRFALVDGSGRVRGVYDSTSKDDLQRLKEDARRL